jgi:hypothetical protein
MDDLIKCIRFADYVGYTRTMSNVVAALTNVLARIHDLPPEDFENTIGRMARIYSLAHKDTGYLVKVIWDTGSVPIAGSHLNYIQAIICKPKGNGRPYIQQQVTRNPDKFTSGKHGHVVNQVLRGGE